jgi:hypothetical protein
MEPRGSGTTGTTPAAAANRRAKTSDVAKKLAKNRGISMAMRENPRKFRGFLLSATGCPQVGDSNNVGCCKSEARTGRLKSPRRAGLNARVGLERWQMWGDKKAHSRQDAVGSGTPARLLVKGERLRAQRRLRYGRSARLQAAYPDLAGSRVTVEQNTVDALVRMGA